MRAIMGDPGGSFTARAITRDVNSAKARVLADTGAEVMAADVDDEASLATALKGAYGAYFVTFFWEHFSPEYVPVQPRFRARVLRCAQYQRFPGAEPLVADIQNLAGPEQSEHSA